jgi:hypothetical protein
VHLLEVRGQREQPFALRVARPCGTGGQQVPAGWLLAPPEEHRKGWNRQRNIAANNTQRQALAAIPRQAKNSFAAFAPSWRGISLRRFTEKFYSKPRRGSRGTDQSRSQEDASLNNARRPSL